MRRAIFLSLFLVTTLCFAETNSLQHLIAIDTSWTLEGLENEGMGWGMLLEYQLFPNWGARLRHAVVETAKQAVGKRVVNTVSSLLVVFRPWATQNNWLQGWGLGTGFGYDEVLTSDLVSGAVADSFLLPFVDPNRSKTGIAMYTAHVDLEGITIGILF